MSDEKRPPSNPPTSPNRQHPTRDGWGKREEGGIMHISESRPVPPPPRPKKK